MFLSLSAAFSHIANGWEIHDTVRFVIGVPSSGTRGNRATPGNEDLLCER